MTVVRATLAAAFFLVATVGSAAVYPHFLTRAGTQTFNPNYAFHTTQTRLVETAHAIHAMGSDVIKLELSRRAWGYTGYNGYQLPTSPASYPTLAAMAENEPSFRAVFDMPFRTYVIWAYPRTITDSFYHNYWRDGLTTSEATAEYNEIRALAEYFLTQYAGTGKTFLIGHWEGDWAIRGHYDKNLNPTDTAIGGMIAWLTARQNAINDARAAHPSSNVKVLNYAEVNLVLDWVRGWTQPWQKTVANSVLPHVVLDLVSYSAYDSANQVVLGGNYPAWHIDCLNYIESVTTFSAAAPYNKKVFIGEYGASVTGSSPMMTPAQQTTLAALELKAAAGWGCPFVLYWQMYDNENAGFWLIDNTNTKVGAWYKHQEFLGKAHTLKNLYRFWMERNPTWAEMNAFSGNWDTYDVSAQLNAILNSPGYAALKTNAQYLSFLFLHILGNANPSDPDYLAYLSQLNGGTPRSTVLDSILNSTRFKNRTSDHDFAVMLYTGTLQRPTVDTNSAEFLALMASLSGGTPRATVWRSFLNSAEFRDAELGMRDDDTVGSANVFEKYFFTFAPPAGVGTEALLHN